MDDFGEEGESDPVERRQRKLYDYVNRSEVVYEEPEDEAVWRFGRTEMTEGRILGRFGKIFTEEQTQWDEDKKDYVQEREEVEVADVSHFVIFPTIPGIVFNRKLRIGPKQFQEAFIRGYNQSGIGGEIELKLLRTGGEYDFATIVQMAERLNSVDFELEPTNPYPDEDMEILDDHIRAMNANQFELGATASEEEERGLDPREDFIRSAGAMADGDYGEFKAEYEDEDGYEHRYDSRGDYATSEKDDPDGLRDLTSYLDDFGNLLTQLVKRDQNSVDDRATEAEEDTQSQQEIDSQNNE